MAESDPLTNEEVQAIYETWALVSNDLKGNGIKFFIRFFTEYPIYQRVFRGFANIPIDQLATNKRLQAHGFTVFSSIGSLVANMDDPEVLSELLVTIGQNHIKHKLKIEDFQNVKKVLLQFLKEELGEACTQTALIAWQKVLTIVVNKIGEGLAKNNSDLKSELRNTSSKLQDIQENSTTRWVFGILGVLGFMTVLYNYRPKRHL